MAGSFDIDFLIKIFILGLSPWVWYSVASKTSPEKNNLFSCFFSCFIPLCIFISLHDSTYEQISFVPKSGLLSFLSIFILIFYLFTLFLESGNATKKEFLEWKEVVSFFELQNEKEEIVQKYKAKIINYKLILIVQPVTLVIIFCLVGMGLARNSVLDNYLVIVGQLRDDSYEPINRAAILFAKDDIGKILYKTETDSLGFFNVTIHKKTLDLANLLIVKEDTMLLERKIIDGNSVRYVLQDITNERLTR